MIPISNEYELTDSEAFDLLRDRIEKRLNQMHAGLNRTSEGYVQRKCETQRGRKTAQSNLIGLKKKVSEIQKAADQLEDLVDRRADIAQSVFDDLEDVTDNPTGEQ